MTISTLWYTRCPAVTASSLAIHQGFLEQEFASDGIEVLSLLQAGERNTRESHFSHTLPNSFRHGGNIPPTWARSTGGDVKVIGLTASKTPYYVLSLAKNGIATPSDLKGKRLGLPRRLKDSIDFARAMYLRTYELALAAGGLSWDDVEIVELGVTEGYLDDSSKPSRDGALWNAAQLRAFQRTEIFALIRDEVDAIPSSGYWGAELIAGFGCNTVFDSRDHAEGNAWTNSATPLILSVNAALIEERPDLVVRWLKTLLKAAEWGRNNPSDAVRIAAQETGVAEYFVHATNPEGVSAHFDISLSDDVVESLSVQKDFLLRNGFIKNDFAVKDWIEFDLLKQAQDSL